MAASAVIVAAGQGVRAGGGTPKQFRALGGRPVLAWSIDAFLAHPGIDELVVVLAPDRAAEVPAWIAGRAVVAAGGRTRADSVRAGLAASRREEGTILVHDGVRPFVSSELIQRVLEAAARGPALPAVPLADTIKTIEDGDWVGETLPRERLRAAQTPQGCPAGILREAYEVLEEGASTTDEAQVLELRGHRVRLLEGDPMNFKITTAEDLARARWLVERGTSEVLL